MNLLTATLQQVRRAKRLSQLDLSMRMGVSEADALGQGKLARHLGVAKSTFSETVDFCCGLRPGLRR